MQLMTWPLARLGSRFGFLFEPYQRRVMHSALGRFLDRPMDFSVGLIEPDGTERVMPFTKQGKVLYACEQSERVNSITYRGYSENAGLKYEINLHSPFYPQDERLCVMPAFYVECRVTWTERVRGIKGFTDEERLEKVKLFIRLKRPDTDITSSDGRINLEYDVPLKPEYVRSGDNTDDDFNPVVEDDVPRAHVYERIQSLNDGAEPMVGKDGGVGLSLELPVSKEGSGKKWRLVWCAHTADPVLEVQGEKAKFRYLKYWKNLDEVIEDALAPREDNLAHSRRFAKLLEQSPLNRAKWHLLVLGFQSYLSNTFWCDLEDGREWFSTWEGVCMLHSTVDVEYNMSMFYFAVWPDLLKKLLNQWADHSQEHSESGGVILNHDMGRGMIGGDQSYQHSMPVEDNADYLLLLQSYTHWTGDTELITKHAGFVSSLVKYLLWTDRDGSGFPNKGNANTVDDGSPAVQFSRKQTYLGIKRVSGLLGASDLLGLAGEDEELADQCKTVAQKAIDDIECVAWLGDHYAVCVDLDATGLRDVWTGKPLPASKISGWDDYSIYASNGLLLPMIIDKRPGFRRDYLVNDLTAGIRETLTPYGCSHTTSDEAKVWVSQNMWRDFTGRYFQQVLPALDSRYWDLQTFSNTGQQSFGFIDTYIGNELSFYPRGVTAFGFFLAGPRIQIDRLAEGGAKISIRPDQFRYSRWPLLPLADWKAGKIPVCVVDNDGNVSIEGGIEAVEIKTPISGSSPGSSPGSTPSK